MTPPLWVAAVTVVAALGGCDDGHGPVGSGSVDKPLVIAASWRLVAPTEDPVSGRPSSGAGCDDDALTIEAGVLEFDTGGCGWITAVAPVSRSLPKGALLELAWLHDSLVSPRASHARLVIRTAGEQLFERRIALPHPAGFVEARVRLTEPIHEGDDLYAHVDNHGANTYRLIRLAPREAPDR